jgi:hypothetical protein
VVFPTLWLSAENQKLIFLVFYLPTYAHSVPDYGLSLVCRASLEALVFCAPQPVFTAMIVREIATQPVKDRPGQGF